MDIGDIMQDRYRVARFLGRGGMGAVYLCEDLRLPGKHWALKEMLIYDPTVEAHVKESFEREAKMLASLRHRNLPVIVDYFSSKQKQYLVMEYIEGETLSSYIERVGTPEETQILRWALELAQVLDYLHRQERPVIFRDLKPENIIVTEDLHVKLVDFGLARHFEPGKRRDTQASGSVGYAPPEQWEDLQQTDARSDIYSLGATLYYVLTGKPPSPIYGSHRIRPYRPGIDAGIEALVLRCLQPEPGQRYADTEELIKDLLRLLSEEKHQKGNSEERTTKGPLVVQRAPRQPIALPRKILKNQMKTPAWLLVLMTMASLLFLAGAAFGLRKPAPPDHSQRLFQILEATEPIKTRVRAGIAAGNLAGTLPDLDSLVTRYPEDAEGHILRNNVNAMIRGEVLRIPVLTSAHGKDREGFQILYGLAMAQAEVNLPNGGQGVAGKGLVLDLYDDRSEVERALELVQEIAANQEYPVGIGPFTSQNAIAIAPVLGSTQLPMISPAASDPRVWVAGRYVFTVNEPDTKKVQALADYFLEKGLTRGAIFRDKTSIISRSYADEFIEHFQSKGGYLASTDTYQGTTVEYGPLIREALDNKADFIFMADYRVPNVIEFLNQLRAAGSIIPLASQVAAFNDAILSEGGGTLEGLLTSTYFHPQAPDQKIEDFTQRFHRTFGGMTPSHREANAYDSLLLAVQAINEVGTERDALRDYLASIGEQRPAYNGITGDFAPGRRLERRQPYLVRVRGGRFVLVE